MNDDNYNEALDNDYEDELEIEPEWCEDCSESMPADGIAYTFDYYVKDGIAYCEHCNGYV